MGNEEEDELILDLIIADEIEDTPYGKYINDFTHWFMSDFLTKEDNNKLSEHGATESYCIVKKRKNSSESYFVIPSIIEGRGYASMICPSWKKNYTDEELHKKLPGALKKIDKEIRKANAKGIVMATQRLEVKVVKETFESLGYKVYTFKRKNKE